MPVYQAWCRPHGQPDQPAQMSFLLDRVDYRRAWQDAMALCFGGGSVVDAEGKRLTLRARRWTVQKLKLFELVQADDEEPAEPPETDQAPNLMDPEVRERELARLYAGRKYDNVRFRARHAYRLSA